MSIGDRVLFRDNKENVGYEEFFDKIGTIIDTQCTRDKQKRYFRVSFDNKEELSSFYIDVGSWRVMLANENR